MPASLPAVFDARALRRLRTRLRAWWDGVEPAPEEEEPAQQDVEAGMMAAPEDILELEAVAPPAARSRAPLDPRLEALGLIWGEDRVFLGDGSTDRALYAALDLDPMGALGLLGPGLAGPAAALSAVHEGALRVYEWRVETCDPLKRAIAASAAASRTRFAAIDLAVCKLPVESLDGLISLDEFTFADGAARLAAQITKALRPGARAVLEWTAGSAGRDVAPAFASAFAEPHIRSPGHVAQAFEQAGCEIEAEEDVTQAHLQAARARLRAFAQALDRPPEGGLAAMRELAWEAESWAARRSLMHAGRLERRRLVARRL